MSGNPGGRPKGLVAIIGESTQDGEELAQFYLTVFRGKRPGRGPRPSLADQMAAATWLADRGFGKPVQGIEGTIRTQNEYDLTKLTPEELDAWLAMAEKTRRTLGEAA